MCDIRSDLKCTATSSDFNRKYNGILLMEFVFPIKIQNMFLIDVITRTWFILLEGLYSLCAEIMRHCFFSTAISIY